MRIFSQEECPQGSPTWWELRRGIPTASSFDRIITAKKMLASEQQEGLIAELTGDVANMSPHWFTERYSKPPNKAVEDGVARESESRKWLEFEQDCTVMQVGFCLHDSGMYGCSPDGILVADTGCMRGTLELKNPMLHTQTAYVLSGALPSEYRAQVAGHLIVTGLASCTFLSYCPPLPPLLIEVRADEFALRLKEELEKFAARYLAALEKLGLLERFRDIRRSVLEHHPEEGADHAGTMPMLPRGEVAR